MSPLDDVIKDTARKIRAKCPDTVKLCHLIDDNYSLVLRNGLDPNGKRMEEDGNLQSLFKSVINASRDW